MIKKTYITNELARLSRLPEKIAFCCSQSPSPDNTQPLHFTWDGEKLNVSYDLDRVQDRTFDATNQATLLTVGGAFETGCQILDSLGFQSDPDYSIQGSLDIYGSLGVPVDSGKQINPQHPVLQRHTNRFNYRKDDIPAEVLDKVAQYSEKDARLEIFKGDRKKDLFNLVYRANKIRFQTREVHEWLGESLRFAPAPDGLEVSTLNLPPGGSQFMKLISDWGRMSFLNKLGMFSLLSKIDSTPLKSSPAVIVFICGENSASVMDAGRLLVRVWSYLNSCGIACHPYYVVSDQLERMQSGGVPEQLTSEALELERETANVFALKPGQKLVMLLRAGYPKKVAPASKRLPVADVYTDKSGLTL